MRLLSSCVSVLGRFGADDTGRVRDDPHSTWPISSLSSALQLHPVTPTEHADSLLGLTPRPAVPADGPSVLRQLPSEPFPYFTRL